MKNIVFAAALCVILMWPFISGGEVIEVKVSGLVCDFCARTIQKSLARTGKVEDVQVDLDKGEVFVQTKPDVLISDEEINRAILDSGYDPLAINRGRE
jgi:copper chaperone CopZ